MAADLGNSQVTMAKISVTVQSASRTALAAATDEPPVDIRSSTISTFLPGGQKVLIVEDLISTGGSSVAAANAVREADCTVTDILAIVTWELPKSAAIFREAGLNLHTMTDYSNLIGSAASNGSIPSDQLSVVLQFKEDPEGWGTKMGF